jgi:hypothetical protein
MSLSGALKKYGRGPVCGEEEEMPAKVREKGQYELFETNHGNKILVLNNQHWFAWVQGQQGEILVQSDSDHEKDHTVSQGHFYLVDFEEDPKFRDTPHLFLQKDGDYHELILPNGLPTERDHQKLIVATDETLPCEELEDYLHSPDTAG